MQRKFGLLVVGTMTLASCGRATRPFIFYPDVWDTPLHQAAEGHSKATVLAKLAEVGDVDARGRDGLTPLMLAARSSEAVNDNLLALIHSGANVNARDDRGMTPLMYATTSSWRHQHGRFRRPEDTLERLAILLDAGADIDARDDRGATALMMAAAADRFASMPNGEACTLLVQRGADVNARDADGLTPLMYAARSNMSQVAALLAAGAEIDGVDHEGRTALMMAFADEARSGWTVRPLLDGSPNLELTDHRGWTALAHAAWRSGVKPAIGELIDAGARLEALGWTPLHEAAVRRDAQRVSELLGEGADPNARDRWGRTPVMWAARFIDQDRETIPALVRAGADVNAADEDGATALHIAASNAWDGELADLLHDGARVDARDHMGRTPLMYAASPKNHDYQVQYLLKAGAEVDGMDNDGRTALMHAAIGWRPYGHSVEFLLAAHADKTIRDHRGRTAYDYALEATSEIAPAEHRELLGQLQLVSAGSTSK